MSKETNLKVNGLNLKIIAIVTMIIDHIGVGIVSYVMLKDNYALYYSDPDKYEILNIIYLICRAIGRSAFPIYSFLLVEGFFYSHSRWKYLRNILTFALISEIPFDCALITRNRIKIFDLKQIYEANSDLFLESQNVFITIAMGLVTIWLIDIALGYFLNNKMGIIIGFIIFGTMGTVAQFVLKSDYGIAGIILITLFYIFHDNRKLEVGVGYAFMVVALTIVFHEMEVWSLPAFILIYLYNGRRGYSNKILKYIFYGFYPVHLIVIFVIRVLIVR